MVMASLVLGSTIFGGGVLPVGVALGSSRQCEDSGGDLHAQMTVHSTSVAAYSSTSLMT